MPTKQIVFALVTFLHDLFTAIWVGGLITLGTTVLPSARLCWEQVRRPRN